MKDNSSRILLENLYIVPMTEPIITLSRYITVEGQLITRVEAELPDRVDLNVHRRPWQSGFTRLVNAHTMLL